MKLYSTVRSERAKKSQGGNDFLSAELTIGEVQPRIVLTACITKRGPAYLLQVRILDGKVLEYVIDELGNGGKTYYCRACELGETYGHACEKGEKSQ